MSEIVHGTVGGQSLTDEQAVGVVMLLISAGHNTTTNAMGAVVARLATEPGLLERLRSEPELRVSAIEETLRLDAPQQAMPRVATADVDLDDAHIRAGDLVWLGFGAANRDPDAFPDPDSFVADRFPNRHVAFGRGAHLCLGAPLARLQLTVFLDELIVAVSDIEVTGAITRPRWPRLGFDQLPVRMCGNVWAEL